MKRRRVSKILIISVLFTSMFTGNAAAAPTPTEGNLQIQAKSAVLLDASTGTFLYEQNAHEQLPPASVTKIMTMLLTMEAIEQGKIGFEDKVTISARAASMGGSQMYMEAGEQQTL